MPRMPRRNPSANGLTFGFIVEFDEALIFGEIAPRFAENSLQNDGDFRCGASRQLRWQVLPQSVERRSYYPADPDAFGFHRGTADKFSAFNVEL